LKYEEGIKVGVPVDYLISGSPNAPE